MESEPFDPRLDDASPRTSERIFNTAHEVVSMVVKVDDDQELAPFNREVKTGILSFLGGVVLDYSGAVDKVLNSFTVNGTAFGQRYFEITESSISKIGWSGLGLTALGGALFLHGLYRQVHHQRAEINTESVQLS